ncbi:major capsid protein [Azospirillum rugosum]|uniref:Phage major capsid protein E n=1 Tax=Azospirillum rugosum TaxID=416170 RepID=A0ABS4SI00_9PROT|nr:major capsid protein [Azospirillum rugosum]MBP2291040.1 hypothetical protein [Azospirillum rugosum]MDQ0524896.1 hypothetical protein [Azospirillum rugosum]
MGISIPQISMQNLFIGRAFDVMTLTTAVNNVPYTPQFLGSLGDDLFLSEGVRTTDIAIQETNGNLEVIKTSERGAPAEQSTNPKRNLRKASTVRIAKQAHVNADEVQNALGDAALTGTPQLQTLEALINERAEGAFGLRAQVELTHEYHRLGGIKGVVLDKDGAELYDWYNFFGISPLADHTTNFGALTTDGGTFEQECMQLVREMTTELEGLPIVSMQPVVLCGDNYYDRVYTNKEVKAARKNRDAGRGGDVFEKSKAFSSFSFGGITFANYRGTKDGKVGIGKDEGRMFPLGVKGLFQMLFGPPDLLGMANFKGLPIYMYMPPEEQTIRRATVEAQSDPLTLCVRPRALRRLKHEATPADPE